MALVAIKLLPRQIAASDKERERFKIDLQAVAGLNHHRFMPLRTSWEM